MNKIIICLLIRYFRSSKLQFCSHINYIWEFMLILQSEEGNELNIRQQTYQAEASFQTIN
jgi:hypothetical protein